MNDPDPSGWNDVRFRPRQAVISRLPHESAQTRFVIGVVVFLAVALAYPWYSYRVQSRLLAADVDRALAHAGQEAAQAAARAGAEFQHPQQADAPMGVPPPRPRILGISEGAMARVIVADLDGASLADAQARLCRDAARWTRAPTRGRTFRVQAYRRSRPAIPAGSIRC